MSPPSDDHGAGPVTTLLRDAAGGSADAARRLMPLVYAELRALAASYLERERRAHTLQPTALVHEAFARLMAGRPVDVADRTHFFALAAGAMRHVLVDHARERAAAKRGDGMPPVTLDEAVDVATPGGLDAADVLAVHDALERLAGIAPRQAQVVELRYYGGLTLAEIASHLNVSTVTIDGDWAAARAWLYRRLKPR